MQDSNFYSLTPQYKKFAQSKDKCKSCYLCDIYKQVVQSEGNVKNPTFMIIGEAPGADEVEHKRPFIGKSGQELRKHLRRIGFNKSNTLISNVLPCRPKDNRFPFDAKISRNCAKKWLLQEIKMVQPKLIITCGSKAAEIVREFHDKTLVLGKYRGIFEFINGSRWCISTWHPSYVLRCKNDPAKASIEKEFIDDLEKAFDYNSYITNKKDNTQKVYFAKKKTNNSYVVKDETYYTSNNKDTYSVSENFFTQYPTW